MVNYYSNDTFYNCTEYYIGMPKINSRYMEANDTYSNVGIKINSKQKKKSIRVELTEDEYALFSQYAKRENISLRHLAKTRMLDSSIGLQEYKERQARLLPKLQSLIDQVEDEDLQFELRKTVRDIYADM